MSDGTAAERTHLPSGRQYRIADGRHVAVATEVGACLREYTYDGDQVIDGYPETSMCSGSRGMPLLPWPNRIEDGSYTFDGETHQLPIDRPADRTAIHGLTRWLNWETVAHRDASVELAIELYPRPGYPFHLGLGCTYGLGDDGLSVTLTAANLGRGAAPFGAGHHPYITPRRSLDRSVIHLPAGAYAEDRGRGLPGPTGPVAGSGVDFTRPRAIGAQRLAHSYTDLVRDARGHAQVDVDGTVVWLGQGFRWLLVFSGEDLPSPSERRRSIAVEPMTCPANAFRSGRDLLRLEPGQRISFDWGIRPRPPARE